MAKIPKELQDKYNQILDSIKQYQAQVAANKETPFFNNQGNNPVQWLGKVGQDFHQRGAIEAAQDLTYPVLENPYIEPLTEPLTGDIREAVSKIPNQGVLAQGARAALGLSPDVNTGQPNPSQQPPQTLTDFIMHNILGRR